MGHADESMAAVYRQGIEDERLIDVGLHVHAWLFGVKKKMAKKKPAKKAAKPTPAKAKAKK